jgi:hypothetical protein
VRENGQYIIVDVTDLNLSVRWDKINEITITLNHQWKDLVSLLENVSDFWKKQCHTLISNLYSQIFIFKIKYCLRNF